ncbi:ExbD/TolR family protein [Coraliomargarita parva]|uniref:ExbD/TolR family protein n=1 Tax=Coraliomargarita parva TaxID=3014050 RepID=UPI0022B2CBB5|nr:biopolymer transporter ExbD [Coraliomargarita parva]
MKLWKPDEGEGDVDLTPMIDIVFLLIVFFMTVASMITAEKVPINMPVALNSTIPEEFGERTTITVMRDGSIYSGVYAVTLDELTEVLAREFESDPSVRVFLRADSATEHQYVNDVMQACASVGLSNIVFAAYQSDK